MSLDPVNVGAVPSDGTGDSLRVAGQKLNANDSYLEGLALAAQGLADGLAGGASVADATLVAWAEGGAYEATSVTRDSDGVVTTATVQWPDASAGTFTTTTKDTTWLAVNAYTISHTASGKTVTQAVVTRAADGSISTKPALTVA